MIILSTIGNSVRTECVFLAVQTGEYRLVGLMMGVAVLRGGVLPCFLSDRMYCHMSGEQSPPVEMKEVDNVEVRHELQRVRAKLLNSNLLSFCGQQKLQIISNLI